MSTDHESGGSEPKSPRENGPRSLDADSVSASVWLTSLGAELPEMLAALGHEFRTPLAVIDGYASTLLSQGPRLSPQEHDEFLQPITLMGLGVALAHQGEVDSARAVADEALAAASGMDVYFRGMGNVASAVAEVYARLLVPEE